MLEFYIFTVITNIVVMILSKIRAKYNPKIKAASEELKKATKDSDPWIIERAKAILCMAFPVLNIVYLVLGLVLLLSSEDTVVSFLHKVIEKRMAEKDLEEEQKE